MRVAVVGHVEWVDFARVERVPRPGQTVHAFETWAEPAGGGAVAASQLARLAGTASVLKRNAGFRLAFLFLFLLGFRPYLRRSIASALAWWNEQSNIRFETSSEPPAQCGTMWWTLTL